MPELPDVTVYIENLERLLKGHRLEAVRLFNPFLLRTAVPPVAAVLQRKVLGVSRLGKRIVISLEGDLHLVLHLMIAGRLHWEGKKTRNTLALFEFENGTLSLTEAGTKRRASLHLVEGAAALRALDPGGVEIFEVDLEGFRSRLKRENHTLKRALTDPRLFAGIGNAYSDEILHAARLSPFARTASASDADLDRLYHATRATLAGWVERLRRETGDDFPGRVTAFREGMAVHGRFRRPCPVCGAPIQRIRYAENEANYCARCQTGGQVLKDRSLSRLLREDWPRSLEDWDTRTGRPGGPSAGPA